MSTGRQISWRDARCLYFLLVKVKGSEAAVPWGLASPALTAAAKFPLSPNLGWVGELNLWGSPLPRLWGLFEQSWLPWTQDFTPTGLWYVTVLKLSRTRVPIMQYSLKTKCHLMLSDFWKRTRGNGKQPFCRTYQRLIPKHFSNARCSLFLQSYQN